ncbi:MAG: hypothetical protein ACRDT8_00165 [Micromonosporaceae bacterium]
MPRETPCQVPGCPYPANDAFVCGACVGQLEKALRELPALLDDLDTTFARLHKVAAGVGTGDESDGLPYRGDVSTVRGWLFRTLERWAVYVLGKRNGGLVWARINVRGIGITSATGAADYLLDLADEIARLTTYGPELVIAITDAVAAARRAVDSPADVQFAGVCGHRDGGSRERCQGAVYAYQGAIVGACRLCGARHADIAKRRADMLASAEDKLANATEIGQALTALERPVGGGTIRKLAERGRIVSKGRDARGNPLYRLGDVLDALARPSAPDKAA